MAVACLLRWDPSLRGMDTERFLCHHAAFLPSTEYHLRMRTLIMTGLMLASTGAMARDMFVVVHTRDVEVDIYRCNCEIDKPGCEPMTRKVVRHPGSMRWHVVGGVAPYTVINGGGEGAGIVSITVMDAVGNIATSYGTIGTQTRFFDPICSDKKQDVMCEATPLSIPSQKKSKDATRVRRAIPAREPRTHDPDRVREPAQPPRITGSTFETRPSYERPSPAPSPSPSAPPSVRTVQRSR